MENVKLIVGLGNPGSHYQYTRHNAGFLLVQFLAENWHCPAFQLAPKFKAQVTRAVVNDQVLILALPQTMMNESGQAVAALLHFYKIDHARNFLLAYDDLDLQFGHYKMSRRPPRTHNGVASVRQELGSDDFTHLRLGVDDRDGSRHIAPIDYVLSPFTPGQLADFQRQIFPAALQEIETWL